MTNFPPNLLRFGALVIALLATLPIVARGAFASEPPLREFNRGPFLVQTDFDPSEIADALDVLDDLRRELAQTLRLPEMKERVAVRIFTNEAAWREFYRAKFAPAKYREALYERGSYLFDRSGVKGRVYLHRNKFFLYDLRHECTHAILAASLGASVPIWLDEGIAEYFEQPPEARIYNPEWFKPLLDRLDERRVTSLEKLEKLTSVSEMTDAKYCDSWAWVCYALNDSQETRDALTTYLADLSAKKFFAPKISKRLANLLSREKLETAFERFCRNLARQTTDARQGATSSPR